MATVFIPSQLADVTGDVASIEVAAATVGQVVDALEARFAGIGGLLRQGDRLAPNLAVSVDGTIATLGLLARVGPQSEVHFLPALGGG